MTSAKNCLFFGPYLLVYFETNPFHNIDCGHVSLSLTSPCPLIKFFVSKFKISWLKKYLLKEEQQKKTEKKKKKKNKEEEFNSKVIDFPFRFSAHPTF